jgi:N-acylneuraminate cytidylyltransferase
LNNLAIIPARGGSKRIPGKNIKHFLGKPIIAYVIETAFQSQLFEEVMVSTDNHDIANLSSSFGANIPFLRNPETSDDFAPLNDVYHEVIKKYKEIGKTFDSVCIILPTAVFCNTKMLREAYQLMVNKNFASVRPVTKFEYPIQKAFKLSEQGHVQFFFPEQYLTRTQDLETAFHDTGQFYWINKGLDLVNPNRGAIIIDKLIYQDIDDESDWKLAELKYKLLNV